MPYTYPDPLDPLARGVVRLHAAGNPDAQAEWQALVDAGRIGAGSRMTPALRDKYLQLDRILGRPLPR